MTRAAEIAANLADVRARIDAAARRAGRDPASVTLVAVTKTKPLEDLLAAYEAGVRHFGENRVQEAEAKFPSLPPGRREAPRRPDPVEQGEQGRPARGRPPRRRLGRHRPAPRPRGRDARGAASPSTSR